MEELAELKRRLAEERPATWDGLPDISLYMDQIISYMPRQLTSFVASEGLTPAMVNNYIKDGLLPRAEGKKYMRTHLAYLTAICALKQVLSVKETRALLSVVADGNDPEALYTLLLGELDVALTDTAQALDPELAREELAHVVLRLALRSYADKLACVRLLSLLAPEEPKPEHRKKGNM